MSVEDRAGTWLFVYGSLKRGRASHHELQGATYVSEACTAPCFALRVVAGYPALVPGARTIHGELYRIASSGLPALDAFEGEGYVRREIELESGARAQAYLSSVLEAGEPYPADQWPSPRD